MLMNSRDVITLVFFQNFGKCRWLPGHQVVGAGGVGAFQKLVVVGVLCDLERARGLYDLRMVLDEIEELLPEALADFQLRAREHFPVFRNNGVGNVQPGRFGDRKQEDGALESVRLERRRDDDVGIDHQPERDHPRLGFCSAGRLDDLVNLPRRELVRALALRFLADHPEHLRLGRGKAHIVADAEQHRLGRAALLDHERAVLVFHPAQQLAETGTGAQRRYGDGVVIFSGLHKLSSVRRRKPAFSHSGWFR